MAICGIIGDSIALGLAMANPKCDYNAVQGRSSYTISKQYMPEHYKWVVISSGTNSVNDPQLRKWLYTTRKKLNTSRVVWVLPANRSAAMTVKLISNVFGDKIVDFKTGRDGIHPASYKVVWKDINKKL